MENWKERAAEIAARIAAKRAALAALEGKRRELVAKLLDAGDGKRAGLVAERSTLAAEGLALQDEIGELHRRYCAAVIGGYEVAEASVLVAVSEAKARETAARLAVNAAIDEQRRWLVTGRRELDRAEGDREAAAWASKVNTLRAEGQIAKDAVIHAAWARDAAHTETEAMRERLAKLPPGETLAEG
jgi:hypothetical protein